MKIMDGEYEQIRILSNDGEQIAVISDDDMEVTAGYQIRLKPSEKEEEEFPGKTIADDLPCPHCSGNKWAIVADERDEKGFPICNEDEKGNIACHCGDCDKEFKINIAEEVSLAA